MIVDVWILTRPKSSFPPLAVSLSNGMDVGEGGSGNCDKVGVNQGKLPGPDVVRHGSLALLLTQIVWNAWDSNRIQQCYRASFCSMCEYMRVVWSAACRRSPLFWGLCLASKSLSDLKIFLLTHQIISTDLPLTTSFFKFFCPGAEYQSIWNKKNLPTETQLNIWSIHKNSLHQNHDIRFLR